MNIKEAAEKWNISTKSIQRWIKDGTITATKVGKQMIIPDDTEKPETKPYKKVASTTIEQYTIKPYVLAWMIQEAEAGNPVWKERLEWMRVNPHYSETVAKEPWFHKEDKEKAPSE